jgi:hypothetical protein
MTSPGNPGEQCNIFILAPRAAATDDAGLYQQLAGAVGSLLSNPSLSGRWGSSDYMSYRTRGLSGAGWLYVGLALEINQNLRSDPYLALFGQTAVPVIPHSEMIRLFEEENSSATGGWITRLCRLERATTGNLDPYEICLNLQN